MPSHSSAPRGGRAGPSSPSLIWYGVLCLVLDTLAGPMTTGAVAKLQKEQFGDNAYWILNGSMILQSLLSVPGIALCGYLSQPDRLGRKNVLLALSIMSSFSTVMLAVTGNQYIILSIRTLFLVTGFGQSALNVVLFAWCTDWCNPEEKVAHLGRIYGSKFGGIFVGMLASVVMHLGDVDLFRFAALVSFACPAFITFCFPGAAGAAGIPASGGQEDMKVPLVPPGAPEARRAPADGLLRPWSHILASLRYLFLKHGSITVIFLMINFTDSAVQDNIALFLTKERDFEARDVSKMIGLIGVAGFLIQFFVVPAINSRGLRPQALLVPCILAMAIRFMCYAFMTDKLLLTITGPIGSIGYVAPLTATAIVSGVSRRDDLPHDQGTLMGTLAGLKMLASCVGPFVLAALTTNWSRLPAPLNFVGVGYGLLAFVMMAAFALSLRLWRKGLGDQGPGK